MRPTIKEQVGTLKNFLVFLFAMLLSGCANSRWTQEDTAKAVIPAAIVGGYFASTTIHELGHAAAAEVSGAYRIKLTLYPTRDEGSFHLALTKSWYRRDLEPYEETFHSVAGPLANLSMHTALRQVLRTGYVPVAAQTTVRWLSFMSQGAVYGELLFGFLRLKGKDFGKEPLWVCFPVLGGILVYDIFDLITDGPRRYFGSLVGAEFYTKQDSQLKPLCGASPRGGFLGLSYDW